MPGSDAGKGTLVCGFSAIRREIGKDFSLDKASLGTKKSLTTQAIVLITRVEQSSSWPATS